MDPDVLKILAACNSGDTATLNVSNASEAYLEAFEKAIILEVVVVDRVYPGSDALVYQRTALGREALGLPERIHIGFLAPGDIVLSPTGGLVTDVSLVAEDPSMIDVIYEGGRCVRLPRFGFVEVYRG